MRLFTVLKKNIGPIIFIGVAAAILIYMTQRKEGFQTPVLGDSCISETNIINGKCNDNFYFSYTRQRCEKRIKYCIDNTFRLDYNSTRNTYTCVKKGKNSIQIPPLIRFEAQDPLEYRCDSGYVRTSNFKCAKSGTFVCPTLYEKGGGTCVKCISPFYHNSGTNCKDRDDIIKPALIKPPICSA